MREVVKNVYYLGSSGCCVYLVDTQSYDGLVLIDGGMSLNLIKKISKDGLNPREINHCIITHCHIDHIGACPELMELNPQIRFYAHELDADPIEKKGFDSRTAASWYGVDYKPVHLAKRFMGHKSNLKLGNYTFTCLHTPGHTPGSLSILLETDGKKIIFGQDIHGPFNEGFGSNLVDYQKSMQELLDYNADILCEGHSGVKRGKDTTADFISYHKRINQP